MDSQLYKKQYVVVEYCPGLQGVNDEFVASYTFDTEEQAKKFAKQKNGRQLTKTAHG